MSDEQRTYPHGVPCWVDTEQPDLAAATHFYGGLFGWAFHDAVPPEAPGSYLIATLHGRDVAAIGPGPRSPGSSSRSLSSSSRSLSSSKGAPSWQTYIAVTDADASAALITASGGAVVFGPEDAGPGGRMAIVTDPAGAEFRLWQARRRLGAQLVNEHDSWNFSDLVTPDPDAILPFYVAVFGWQVDTDDGPLSLSKGAGMIRLPGYGDHLASTIDPGIYERQAFAPSGFADVVAGLSVGQPGWVVRFTVADRDASVATAERLGATVISSTDTEWTHEAVIRDPQGAELTLSQLAPPA